MKGSPAIGTRLLNGLELKHQSRFGLDCLNDHSIAEDLSRLLVERTSRGVEAFNYTRIQSMACGARGMLITAAGWSDSPHNRNWQNSEYFRYNILRKSHHRAEDQRR